MRAKNVGKGEGIFRLIFGVILIVLAYFISGVFRWVLGLGGVGFIPTATVGYWP